MGRHIAHDVAAIDKRPQGVLRGGGRLHVEPHHELPHGRGSPLAYDELAVAAGELQLVLGCQHGIPFGVFPPRPVHYTRSLWSAIPLFQDAEAPAPTKGTGADMAAISVVRLANEPAITVKLTSHATYVDVSTGQDVQQSSALVDGCGGNYHTHTAC